MIFKSFEIRPFCNNDLLNFTKMFCDYFRNDFKLEIKDDQAESLCIKIADSVASEITSLDVLLVDGELVGFISYQIDSPKSDWCEREGWGFIREIYVNRSLRGKNLGAKLVAHVENILYNKEVKRIYLTSDEADKFWCSCGYKKSGEVSNINHDPIYEK